MKLRATMLMLILAAPALAGDEDYTLGPDSMRQEVVPQGTVTKDVLQSKVFPETVRDYWVYLPAQYDYKFVGGAGGHSGKHGGAILPDSLRWLWQRSRNKFPVCWRSLLVRNPAGLPSGLFGFLLQHAGSPPVSPRSSRGGEAAAGTAGEEEAWRVCLV